jgi:hypothetical protein
MIQGGGDLLHGIDLADMLEEYIEQARDAIENSATYPLFDDITGDFVAEAMRAGLISPSEASTARGRYGGISADLLRRLPMFETAKLSDVLAIRRDLEGTDLQGASDLAQHLHRPGQVVYRDADPAPVELRVVER